MFPITKQAKHLRLGRATLADFVALLDALALAAAGVEALEAGALFGFGHGCRLVGAVNLVSLSIMLATHTAFHSICWCKRNTQVYSHSGVAHTVSDVVAGLLKGAVV